MLGPGKPDSAPLPDFAAHWQWDAVKDDLQGQARAREDWWADDRGVIWIIYSGEKERRVACKVRFVPWHEPFWQRLRRRLGF